MSLKNVKLFRLDSVSLVTKLMFFYGLLTLGLLSAILIFLSPRFLSSFISDCHEKIIITLLLSSLVSILFGYLIAKKGLNRMREFENKIEQITANSLDERINLQEWPKELKSFGNKFNTMLDRIQASFVQLSQFSSDIAHELRTPISNLRGLTEVELSRKQLPDDNRMLLEKYMDEFQHLSKLIENLLFLARSDHGQLIIKKETINAREEILKICTYYQAIVEENKIELVCNGNANISVDLILFKRAISNLVSNALKYTKSNGKVIINIESVDRWVNISIVDTGEGIPPQHLNRVFDRFYRVDDSRSSHSGGIGLGLAIVKSIIELHKGKIAIQSQLDVGTTISLNLPLAT